MVKFKFCQTCPVKQVRISSFSFSSAPAQSTVNSPSLSARKAVSRHSISDLVDVPEPEGMDAGDGRDLEIFAYKKTIEAISKELDIFRHRVKELEDAKRDLDGFRSRVRELEEDRRELHGFRTQVKELEAAKKESQAILEQARNINQSMIEQASQVLPVAKEDSLTSSGISHGSMQQQEELPVKGVGGEGVESQEKEKLVRELERERAERERLQGQLESLQRELERERVEKERYQHQEELFAREIETERAERVKHQKQAEQLITGLEAERREREECQQLLEEEKAKVGTIIIVWLGGETHYTIARYLHT
jgi:chromosome segregation ATPase